MTDAELVVIRTFLTRVDADLAKTALDAAGIESMVRSDDAGGLRPHLWMGGIALLVRAEDLERAEEVLATADPSPTDTGDAESAE
jgi:hypothetical protein